MYDVRLMYDLVDVRWTFVLFYLRKSFVHRTFVLSTLPLVRLIVGVQLLCPDVRLQGGLTTGEVLLRTPGCDVGCLLRYVVQTRVDRGCNGCETDAGQDLRLLDRSRTLDLLPEIQAIAFVTRGSCFTVRRQKHLLTTVLTALLGLTQCAGNTVYTG